MYHEILLVSAEVGFRDKHVPEARIRKATLSTDTGDNEGVG